MKNRNLALIIRQLEVPLGYSASDVRIAIVRRLGCQKSDLISFEVVRRSLDARPRRSAPAVVLQVEVQSRGRLNLKRLRNVERLVLAPTVVPAYPRIGKTEYRPVVVGAGPAGLMAAYHLALAGAKPLLIERGGRAEERQQDVAAFWRTGTFNPESNVLFGEGGAGLFSDGKLTARSKDRPRVRRFCETLVACGASADILIDSEPHVGSDKLLQIVPRLRALIEEHGGEVCYHTKLEDITFRGTHLDSIVAGGKRIETRHLLLAVGHSARDVYHLLAKRGVALESKPFAVGVRLELPQEQINFAQYGRFAGNPHLRAASFKLTRRPEGDAAACYSFCMCPGGMVICCASEDGMMTTNGMSLSARSQFCGNAAFIVPVQPETMQGAARAGEHEALAGIRFQETIERAAYEAGGGLFAVPAVRLMDFLADRVSDDLPEPRSCSKAVPADFSEVLPPFVVSTLKSAIPRMLRELNGCKLEDVVLYAAETRSSSPVRILRDEQCCSASHRGLYPAGEGSGYAGGIVSSAVDGLRAAEMLVQRLALDAGPHARA
ncbi:MAG: NAD(P)-binding protein [Verrucomicrobia bacterium]|nr:NAD(P)-binding protein [Verrucomicrobiota bacterium]